MNGGERPDEGRLANWLTLQRCSFNKAKGAAPINEERVLVLEALPGWSWEPGAAGPQGPHVDNMEANTMFDGVCSLDVSPLGQPSNNTTPP